MVIKTIFTALNAKINYKEVKEDWDMCKVFEEIRAEGIESGARGIIQMGKEFRLSDDDILVRLQENLKISLEEAKEYLNKFSR